MYGAAELTAPGNYPVLTVQQNSAPNRFWAIPVVGFMVKVVILIPVIIWLYILLLATIVMLIVNSLSVLFTGTYMDATYSLVRGVIYLETRVMLYVVGLSERYPGFSLEAQPDESFTLELPQPLTPNRGFAIPIVGGIVRGVLLIPFSIWAQIVAYGAYVGIIVASFPVLFAGRYPESLYELARDSARLYLAVGCYGAGLTDSYPSFSISMNHAGTKWVLLGIGILLTLLNLVSNLASSGSSVR